MIGNKRDARLALNAEMCYLLSDVGSTRIAYLVNDIVYKVDRWGDYSTNVTEFHRYNDLLDANLPDNIKLPTMDLFQIGNRYILAAEYIIGTSMGACWGQYCRNHNFCLPDEIENILYNYINDLAPGNVILKDGVYYLVDLPS